MRRTKPVHVGDRATSDRHGQTVGFCMVDEFGGMMQMRAVDDKAILVESTGSAIVWGNWFTKNCTSVNKSTSWFERTFLVTKPTRQVSNELVVHLNRILSLHDPMTFQKMLLDCVHSFHDTAQVAKQARVRRETIWRYRTGAAQAPFGTIVKIVALLGARLVILVD